MAVDVPGHEYRVLIVEDDAIVAKYYALELGKVFYTETAGSIEEGLQRIDQGPNWSAILLDMMLPNGQGINTVTEFHLTYPSVPIVAISGYHFDSRAVIQAGAHTFLRKGSVSAEEIREAVLQTIVRHNTHKAYASLDQLFAEAADIARDSKSDGKAVREKLTPALRHR